MGASVGKLYHLSPAIAAGKMIIKLDSTGKCFFFFFNGYLSSRLQMKNLKAKLSRALAIEISNTMFTRKSHQNVSELDT